MKKLLIAALCAVMAVSCTQDRSSILKVYNWSCYIDESIIPEFEQWYKETTGEDIKVIYQTFDINETMLSKIEKGHEDFDVVCPSDYIIERMLQADMLLPIDKKFEDVPNYIDQYSSPHIKKFFNLINGNGKNANDYAVGYMWGTTGLLYNAKYVSEEEVSTWDIIRNKKFANKILIKDAPRDVYAPVLIYLRQEELKNGETSLDELMFDSSDKSISDVEAYLKEVSEIIAGWEADFGKEQMTQEKAYVSLNWSGDAVWAIREAAEVGVDLRYTVPEEGSCVWFDGWVIPKYAKNIKAARYFINYLCQPQIAIRNMDEIGYVSAIASDEIIEALQDDSYTEPLDLSYFFGPDAVGIHMDPSQYPDKSVIDRCTLEHDWGDDTAKLLEMWSRVKGNEADAMTIIIIIVAVAAIAVLTIAGKSKKKHHSASKRRR